MNIPLITPATEVPWHLTPAAGPLPSALSVLDEHPQPLPPTTNVPPQVDNGTHVGINQRAAAHRMIQQFLLVGPALQECRVGGQPAACDCATGACD